MKQVLVILFLVWFYVPLKSQIIKDHSVNIGVGYTAPVNWDGPTDGKNFLNGEMGLSFNPSGAVYLRFNGVIKDSGITKIELSGALNYFVTEAHYVATPNLEEETRLKYLYGGFEIHFVSKMFDSKLRTDLGVGISTKLFAESSNDNFDKLGYSNLVDDNHKPKINNYSLNAILGIGYARDKISYWIHYISSINTMVEIGPYKTAPIQQIIYGVRFSL